MIRTDQLPHFRRTPSATELRTILETYFPGSFSDEQVKTVELLLRDIFENTPRYDAEANQFYGNSQVWAGRLFMEEARVPRMPRVIDMACVVAERLPGFPQAKPYCPAGLVGTWEDAANPSVRWELGADGAFHTAQRPYEEADRWYVVKRDPPTGDLVHLAGRWGPPKRLGVSNLTADSMRLRYAERDHTLRRVP